MTGAPSNADETNNGLTPELIQAAEKKLPWEISAEKQSRPVLDLSGNFDDSDLTLSDAASADEKMSLRDDGKSREEKDCTEDWASGSVWTETRKALIDLDVLSSNESEESTQDMLAECPQLARIPTEAVVDSAQEALNTIGIPASAMKQNAALLSYPSYLFPGALEFLSNMMMLPQQTIISLCKTNPELLIGGLDGYIQEQSVKNALGSAGNALYGVSRSVANDVGQTIREKRPKGL